VILADTSVWIDHLRAPNERLLELLDHQQILIHPFVIGELALGSMRDRLRTMFALKLLPPAMISRDRDVVALIDNHRLHGRGIGYVDAHLLASTLITPEALIWSKDRRLMAIARELAIAAEFG
jgi:hypothetical protein